MAASTKLRWAGALLLVSGFALAFYAWAAGGLVLMAGAGALAIAQDRDIARRRNG